MKKMILMLTVGLVFGIQFPVQSQSAVVAVVDSGTDFSHPSLNQYQWFNPGERDDGSDNDQNGFIDDMSGWNFANNSSKLYDPEFLGSFSHDVYYFFEVQTRLLKGEGTEADKKWMEEKKGDQEFIAELQKFGNWIHGTHVAGISSRQLRDSKVMSLRIIGAQAAWILDFIQSQKRSLATPNDALIKLALGALAGQQGKMLAAPGRYLADKRAQVANCSFGSSSIQVKTVLAPLLKILLGREATEAELTTYTAYFLTKATESVKSTFVDPALETLFVFAAGNDGTDNDIMPIVPASIRTDHTLTVAATLGRSRIAGFSNYGAASVDVAAPGVGILSSIPGSAELLLSGTSQAAPYVSNMAAQIVDINSKLKASEVRTIIFETVDYKDFLRGRVRSAGIANPKRAAYAAELSLKYNLIEAVARSKHEIADIAEEQVLEDSPHLFVSPMMPLLQ